MTAIQGPSRTAAKAQSRSSSAADWTPTSWRGRPAQQMPVYADAAALAGAEARLRRYPPLVFAGEARKLKAALAKVAAGDAFLLQGGDCAESFAGLHRQQHPRHVPRAAADGRRADLRRRRAGGEGRPHGRPVRQAALVQRREDRRRRAAVLPRRQRQRLRVHRRGAPARSRAHGAGLQPVGRDANLLRAFAQGGYADLHEVNRWNLDFVRNSPASERYHDLAARLDETLNFMAACGLNSATTPQIAETDFFTSHEALLLQYEEALTRVEFDLGRLVRLLGPHAVDRRPHAPARRRACRVPARRAQPAGLQGGPVALGRRLPAPDRHAQPGQRARPHRHHLAHGRRQGGRQAAGAAARAPRRRAARSCGRAIPCTATP